MIQAHQQTSEIDNWAFYEFQFYIEILNKRNKENKAHSDANSGGDKGSTGIMSKIGNLANKFKPKK